MPIDFFKNAKEKEQNRRHLNVVFSACMTSFINNSTIIHNIGRVRKTQGYKALYYEIYNNVLTADYRNYLFYLKNRFNVDENTFEEILGYKEINPNILSPGDYNQKQDFILLFHVIYVSYISEKTDSLNNFVVKLAYGFNYNLQQLQFIANTVVPLLNEIAYSDFEEIEENVYNNFISEYNCLPPIGHG